MHMICKHMQGVGKKESKSKTLRAYSTYREK